jgi:hypothetical protein
MSENRPRGLIAVPHGTSAAVVRKRHRAPKTLPIGWEHPPCLACGGPVPRLHGDSPADWRRRATCGPVCAAQRGGLGHQARSRERWAAAFAAHAPCVVCAGGIHKKSHPKEPFDKFVARSTCSPRCSRIHHAMSCVGPKNAGGGSAPYRKGEIAPVDYAGGFGRQTVRERPDLRRLPMREPSPAAAASGWLW